MSYASTSQKLATHRRDIAKIRTKMRRLQAAIEPEEVQDYTFATVEGPTRLSALFGDKRDLFLVHNMGSSCPFCTLWADGYNGIYPHLASRAAFVVASPDPPPVQKAFAENRGWRFPMVSHPARALPRTWAIARRPAGCRHLGVQASAERHAPRGGYRLQSG